MSFGFMFLGVSDDGEEAPKIFCALTNCPHLTAHDHCLNNRFDFYCLYQYNPLILISPRSSRGYPTLFRVQHLPVYLLCIKFEHSL